MNSTKIEWVKNLDGTQGFTSNPVRGECPIGCPYCYVKPLRTRYGWHKDIRLYPLELEAIRKRKKPSGIFLGSTVELFHEETIMFMPKIIETIQDCPQHRFYLLTKQPQNLPKFSPFPDNCWVGVTITNGDDDRTPLAYMKKVEAKVKFISFEPLLHWWDVATAEMVAKSLKIAGINWLIIGAQTRPYKPPKIEWVREIVEAADKAGIPVFLKDNLRALISERQKPFWYIDHYESHLRQEIS